MAHAEYLRRNLHHAASIGAAGDLNITIEKLEGMQRVPKWLLESLRLIESRIEHLPRELQHWRDEAPDAPAMTDEGSWGDDGVLTLTAAYYDRPQRVQMAVLLSGDADATEEEVAGWTSEQRKLAAEWALSLHTAASDNDDVVVPPRPAFIRQRAPRPFTGSIMDL